MQTEDKADVRVKYTDYLVFHIMLAKAWSAGCVRRHQDAIDYIFSHDEAYTE